MALLIKKCPIRLKTKHLNSKTDKSAILSWKDILERSTKFVKGIRKYCEGSMWSKT